MFNLYESTGQPRADSNPYLMKQKRDSVEVKAPIEDVWAFFSNPKNLEKITPDDMGFETINEMPKAMYAGMMIHHKVGVFPGIRMSWITEITHVKEGAYFVDEQRFGPFAMWHHEHHFEATENGTKITDIISYKVPLGALGNIFEPLLVAPKVRNTFAFRAKKVRELFGAV